MILYYTERYILYGINVSVLEIKQKKMMLTETDGTLGNILAPIKAPALPKRTMDISGPAMFGRLYFNLVGRVLPRHTAKKALRLFSRPRSRFSTRVYDDLVAKSEEFHVTSSGNRINGRIWDNRGPTVLLVHGWETSGLHLGAFIEPLWTSGFRVVIFDGPAHGSSQGKYTNLPDFARAIKQINRSIGPIEHIISHSFGGFASVFMASQWQNEIYLKNLVLISIPNKLTRVIEDFAKLLKLPNQVVSKMYTLMRNFYDADPETIESARMGRTMNVQRVLVVHDRYDLVIPFHNGLEITHDIPNAQLLETENLGHNRLLKNQTVVSRITQFIKMPTHGS